MIIKTKNNRIWTINDANEEKFLRDKTSPFDFSEYSEKDIEKIIQHMKNMMTSSNGVGLSANQIGIDKQIFVCQLPNEDGTGYNGDFFALFNPKIVKSSKQKISGTEGCLSIPETYGDVLRATKVTIDTYDKKGKHNLIKADGLLGIIFQHEIDHLNGILFTDKADNITHTQQI